MRTVNIHGARTHLSRLVEKAASRLRRLGFLEGEIAVPDDLDRQDEIERQLEVAT